MVLLSIFDLRALCQDKSIALTKHAKNRLMERAITIEDIKQAILTGEIIRQYEDDKPFPSCLLLGTLEHNKPIHIVASIDNWYLYIITAYYPDENDWEAGFRVKKEQGI